MYLAAGPDEVSLDAYRLSGPLPAARRLTFSPLGLGIQGLAAGRGAVVIDRTCCGELDFLDRLDLARPGGLPGTMTGAGMDPAIGPNGGLARVVPGYQGCRCDALLVRPSLFGRDQRVYAIGHPGTIVTVAWSPTGRVAAIIGTGVPSGAVRHPVILLDPGTRHEVRISPGPKWMLPSGIWFGPRGQLSWQVEGKGVVIRSAAGQTETVPVLGSWQVTCWLPNGRLFATSFSGQERLGMLDPRTGSVSRIGRIVTPAASFVLDCPLHA